MKTRHTHRRSTAGFSLVEVMVALVVLSVGMLGMAALYVTTLRASSSAISRMQAANLAAEIADHIRANRNAGTTYDTSITPAPTNQSCAGTVSNSCSAANMAINDLFLWQQQIAFALPGNPTGTVTVSGTADLYTYVIQLSWSEPGEATALNYVMRMQI